MDAEQMMEALKKREDAKARKREWASKNRDKINQYKREWIAKNKDKVHGYYEASKDRNAAKRREEMELHKATLKYIRDNNIVLPVPNA